VSYTSILRNTPAGRLRTAARAGVFAALTSAPLLAVTSATADSSDSSGSGLSALQTIGIFVCIPLGMFLTIALLVLAPGWIKGDAHRKEVGWSGATTAAGGGNAAGDQQSVAAGKPGSADVTGGASGSW
jgi:hypothetical protein